MQRSVRGVRHNDYRRARREHRGLHVRRDGWPHVRDRELALAGQPRGPAQAVPAIDHEPAVTLDGKPVSQAVYCDYILRGDWNERNREFIDSGVQVYWVRPAMVSVSDSGDPFIGTWTALMPAAMRNFSALMCAALPMRKLPRRANQRLLKRRVSEIVSLLTCADRWQHYPLRQLTNWSVRHWMKNARER